MTDRTDHTESSAERSPRTGENHRPESSAGSHVDRRTFLNGLAAAGALGAASTGELVEGAAAESTGSNASGWEKKDPQLETPWTAEVGPDNARPEYPRPQMVREDWANLNGVWQFAGASAGDDPPIGEDLDERVLVPYPIESGLSGIRRHEPRMFYRRTFEVSDEWLIPTAHSEDIEDNPNAQRLLLHFERVDWEATVYVNGEQVTTHRGGYDHFAADVTDHLTEEGPQELVLGVYDPTGLAREPKGHQPKGRQGNDFDWDEPPFEPPGLWKTSASGIWDTVWMEPVPETSIENLEMTPDLDADVLRLTVETSDDTDATVVATAYDDEDEKAGRVVGPANEELELPVNDPRLWSPEDPFLYDLDVKLRRKDGPGQVQEAGGGKLLDSVESYFGMRSLGKREVAGTSRPTLNGEMVYVTGSLDSGYWPDGIYTAPTDEAQRYNLEVQKELGFNAVRMHSKLETRRWFAHADQVGLLVWQDVPNMDERLPDDGNEPHPPEALEHFKDEVEQMVTELDTHPSMAIWTAFNEGWGFANHNTDFVADVTALIRELDPERLVDANSGHDVGSNVDPDVGDFTDVHEYPGPEAPEPDPDRISANGEYSTPMFHLEEHTAGECGSSLSADEAVQKYVDSVDVLGDFMVGKSLSASTYTATTDLFGVCNGLVTYDREVVKPELAENGVERVREANRALIEQSRLVMGNVNIDVEAPDVYEAGELLGESQAFEVSVTLSNPESTDHEAETVENVAVSIAGAIPDDWSVSAASPTAFDAIADGESATATWEITPDAVADGEVPLEVTVDYEVGGNAYQYDETVSVSAAQLAYWRFENDATDSSSFDNALSLQNGAGFEREAVEGSYSMSLDGEDDFAQISGFGSGILHDPFDERTVSMWINPDDTSGSQVLYNEGGFFTGMGVRIVDGTLEAIVKESGDAVTISGEFTRTDWTHVAVVFDSGAFRLYVDGEERAANEDVGYDAVSGHIAGSELGGATTSTPWVFDDQNVHHFGGTVDATGVYRSALSADEVDLVSRRSFSVDAPRLYTAGSDPDPFTVDATFSDLREDSVTYENLSMTVVELPDGWSSSPTTETDFGDLSDGENASATWEVTPAPDADGRVEVEVAAEYETGGESRRLLDGASIDSLSSAALAEWRFNGDTADASGNGYTASLVNGASFDDQVVVEGSHSVDLTGADDFVDLADGGEEFLSQSFSERTVSMWVKPQSTAGSQVLYNEGAGFNGMAARIADGTLEAGTKRTGTPATVQGPFDHTDWTHVAVVFDNGALRLYVNGNEIAANEDVDYDTASGGFWGGEFGDAEVSPFPGWTGDGGQGNFDGHVDVSAIYPFALSPELISTLAGSY